jgi:hypothetical protein
MTAQSTLLPRFAYRNAVEIAKVAWFCGLDNLCSRFHTCYNNECDGQCWFSFGYLVVVFVLVIVI